MAFYFDPKFAVGNSGKNHTKQRDHVLGRWRYFNKNEANLVRDNDAQAPVTNAAAYIPRDVFVEFENQTTALMRENNLTLMQDIMPLAKSLPLGKVEHVYRTVSDSGVVVSDLDMTVPAELDKAQYAYDSSIKLFHKTAFGRTWMEMEGQRSEGFDALIDDQANATRALMDTIAGHIYDGVDKSFNGSTAYGIKTSTKVQAVDLDVSDLNINFATSTDPAAIRAGWIAMRDKLWIDNNVTGNITYYVSAEIASNLEQFYGTGSGDSGKTVMQTLMELAGTAAIKVDRSLSGNEVVYGVLSSQFIRPLIGMAVTTVPLFRANPFDNYNFLTWANVGLEIKADYAGKVGFAYAREIA